MKAGFQVESPLAHRCESMRESGSDLRGLIPVSHAGAKERLKGSYVVEDVVVFC